MGLSSGLAALAVLVLLYVVSQLRTYYALTQFRGPKTAGFSKLWLWRATGSGHMNFRFQEVNDRYGKIARVAPRILLTNDASLVRKMNAVRSTYTRSVWYQALRLHPTLDNIVSVRDENVHNRLRHQMSFGYSGKENQFLEQDVDGRLLRLIDLVQEKYISAGSVYKPLNLARATTFFTLDAISTVAFGKSFGFLDLDDDPYGYLRQLHVMLPAIIFFGVFPDIQAVMRLPLMQKLAPKATDANGIGRVMGFAKAVVAERFGPNKIVRKDMLGSFLAHGLSQEQLESETLTQITAGSDSTATAIRMAIFLITSNQRVHSALLSELTSASASGRLTRPVVRDSEARHLPYLQACIKETLRCYPPVTGMLAKESPPQGDVHNGQFIPPNTIIAWNSWGIMRTKEIFGEDVEVFRPERWLIGEGGVTEAKVKEMDETVGMVFGYGRFGCLGRNVALIELNKAVPELLLRFSFQVANPGQPFKERCVGFFLHDDMFFRVEERNQQADQVVTASPEGSKWANLSNAGYSLAMDESESDATTARWETEKV